jgi:hypothetical protein
MPLTIALSSVETKRRSSLPSVMVTLNVPTYALLAPATVLEKKSLPDSAPDQAGISARLLMIALSTPARKRRSSRPSVMVIFVACV